MNQPVFVTVLIATAGIAAASIAIAQSAGGGVQSLRGTQVDEYSIPLRNYSQDEQRFTRNYRQQPPLVPHSIDQYQIDLKANRCLSCHDWTTAGERNAPTLSMTHYLDREGNQLDHIAGTRWFCNQCHVPQADAPPLVENTFRPQAGIETKATKLQGLRDKKMTDNTPREPRPRLHSPPLELVLDTLGRDQPWVHHDHRIRTWHSLLGRISHRDGDDQQRRILHHCHEMRDNVYAEYEGTVHQLNSSGVRATCPDCHVPKAWAPKVVRKIQASKELYAISSPASSTRPRNSRNTAWHWQHGSGNP